MGISFLFGLDHGQYVYVIALLDHGQGFYLFEEVRHVDCRDSNPQGSVYRLPQVSVWTLKELIPEPDVISLVGCSDILVPLYFKLPEVLLGASPTKLRPRNFLHVDLDTITWPTTMPTTPGTMYCMAQQMSVKQFEGILELKSLGLVLGSFHSISAVWMGACQFHGHLVLLCPCTVLENSVFVTNSSYFFSISS